MKHICNNCNKKYDSLIGEVVYRFKRINKFGNDPVYIIHKRFCSVNCFIKYYSRGRK